MNSPLSFTMMEVLQKAIQSIRPTIVGMIELYLRTNDSVSNEMLININQLGLQELLLVVCCSELNCL